MTLTSVARLNNHRYAKVSWYWWLHSVLHENYTTTISQLGILETSNKNMYRMAFTNFINLTFSVLVIKGKTFCDFVRQMAFQNIVKCMHISKTIYKYLSNYIHICMQAYIETYMGSCIDTHIKIYVDWHPHTEIRFLFSVSRFCRRE